MVSHHSLAQRQVETADRAEIDIHPTGHSPAFALSHGVPVLERLVDEGLRSDGDCGVVVVAHLDGGECDVVDDTVDSSLAHCYPVALVKHVVAGEANASHEAGNGVLKNKHEHCRRGSESSQKAQRTAVDDYRHYGNDGEEDDDNLQHSAKREHILVTRTAMVGVECSYGVDYRQS